MKRNLLIVLAVLVTLLTSGCPDVSGPGREPGASGNDKYTQEFLGEWIRMDTGERWYISESSITVNGAAFNRTVTLVKSSAQVITVSEADTVDYFLFASRVANGSFSARVVLIDGNETERTAISRAAIPSGGFKITPPKNPGQGIVVYPNPGTGEIIVDGVIPGDPVEISPEDPEWNNVNVGLTPEDGQDMGIIPLTHGVNLKASIRLENSNADMKMLYADGVSHNFIIEIENIGTVNTTGASYELITHDSDNDIDFDRDFILNSGKTGDVLDTIRPGDKREIRLSLGSKPIEEGRREKKIGIRITSYDTQVLKTKYWDDIVSVNYYKTRIPFRFRSQKPVQGVIKAPGGGTYYFKTEGWNNNYSYSTEMPWSSEDYIIAFLGASVDTASETRYSLAINDQAPSDWDSLLGDSLFLNEPANDIETTAPVLDLETNKTFMGYLHDGDIDYYRINLGNVPPDLKIIDMEEWAIGEVVSGNYLDGNANPGDTLNLDVKFRNYSQESRTITMTGLAADSAYTSYVEITRVPSLQLTLPSQHYGSLTDYTTSTISTNVQLLANWNIDRAFQFRLLPECPAGTMTLTLTFNDNAGIGYVKTFALDVVIPPVNIVLDDYDDEVSIGTASSLNIRAKNTGTSNAAGITATLSKPYSNNYSDYLYIDTGWVSMGALTAGGQAVNAAFQVSVSSSCPAGVEIPLRVTFTDGGNNTWYADFSVYALPPGPANVEAEPLSENSVRVSWDQVAGATSYKVYNLDGVLITTISGSTTRYDHTGLSEGTVYTYRITAIVGGYESTRSSAAARTWEQLMFNRQYSGTVSANVPHYYRFNVTNSASYRCTSGVSVPVRYENGDANWFTLNSGTENQTASQSGWAYFRLSAAGSYSFKISTSEAAVSSFIFPSLSTVISGPGLNETEKTVTFKVPFGTNLDGITPSIVTAYGWTQVTGGTQNFSAPVEYIFTNGAVLQAYTVTITPDGQGGVVVNPPPSGSDETILGLPASGFIVSRSGSGGPPSLSITLVSTAYTSIDWWVDETYKSGEAANNGRTFVVQASAYTIGKHTLTVVVYKDGVPYSNDVDFTVTQ
jgi:hypothetical protein